MDRILDEPDGNPEPIRRKGYMDDILIPGKTREECRENTIRVLKKMEKHGLPANPKKCAFEQEKIDFLGYVIKEGKLEMDPEKVEGLRSWPTPENLKMVRQFLGFGNFYRRFIHHYSDLAVPLHNLLKRIRHLSGRKNATKHFSCSKRNSRRIQYSGCQTQQDPFR